MKILILNWRDIKNPSSGGAEILTHEISKRWVKKGHSVTLFTSLFNGGSKEEVLDGVNIIRRGHPDARYLFWSVHYLAYRYYLAHCKGKVDVVIDEIHGLPFFTPFYVKEKKIALICEVAGSLWKKLYGGLFGSIGRFIELLYLRIFYKGIDFLTISQSTKNDLLKDGVANRNIWVLPMGFSAPSSLKKYPKEKKITLVYVGRISKSKGIEETLAVHKNLVKRFPESKLWIIGRGERKYVDKLSMIINKFGLGRNITFYGYVDEIKKYELMSRAHFLISTSHKEGFGLTIPEAGSVFTPAIVYKTPGLTDIVVDKISGIICATNSPREMCSKIINVIENRSYYAKLSNGAKEESRKYTWDKTSKAALSVMSM